MDTRRVHKACQTHTDLICNSCILQVTSGKGVHTLPGPRDPLRDSSRAAIHPHPAVSAGEAAARSLRARGPAHRCPAYRCMRHHRATRPRQAREPRVRPTGRGWACGGTGASLRARALPAAAPGWLPQAAGSGFPAACGAPAPAAGRPAAAPAVAATAAATPGPADSGSAGAAPGCAGASLPGAQAAAAAGSGAAGGAAAAAGATAPAPGAPAGLRSRGGATAASAADAPGPGAAAATVGAAFYAPASPARPGLRRERRPHSQPVLEAGSGAALRASCEGRHRPRDMHGACGAGLATGQSQGWHASAAEGPGRAAGRGPAAGRTIIAHCPRQALAGRRCTPSAAPPGMGAAARAGARAPPPCPAASW